MMRGRDRWALLGITLVAFGLRVWRLDAHAYRGDEAFATWFLVPDWGTVISAMAKTEPHPPLYYLLTKGWHDLLGDIEFILRFLPALFGTACAPLIAAVGRRAFAGRTGVAIAALSAVAMAVNPFNVWYSQDARMYTQVSAFALASTLFLFSFEEERAGKWRWIGYGVTTFLAMFSHYGFALLLAAQLAVFLGARAVRYGRLGTDGHEPKDGASGRSRSVVRRQVLFMVATQATIGLLVAGWLWYNRAAFSGYGGNGSSPSFIDAIRLTLTSVLFGRSGPADWIGPLLPAALAFIALGAGFAMFKSGRRYETASLIAATVAPFTAFWLLSLRSPVFSDSYLMPINGFLLLLLVAGFALFRPVLRAGWPVLALPVLAASYVSLQNYWWNPDFAKGADWRSEARAIQAGERDGDVVILNYPDPTFQYYYKGRSKVILLPGTSPFDPKQLSAEISNVVKSYRRIWLIPVRASNWDPDGAVENQLVSTNAVLATADFHQVRLALLETPTGALDAAKPADVRFGDAIALRGTSIAQVEPGCRSDCEARIRLVWSALGRPAADYKVFIHVVDSGGAVVAQDDSVPAGWKRPTSGWSASELIVDDHEIAVQLPKGSYRVFGGMYSADGTRLTTAGGQDSVEIGTLSVQ